MLTKSGELFAGLTIHQAKIYQKGDKLRFLKLPKAKLPNGSTIERYTKLHFDLNECKDPRLYVEAMTQDGKTVFCEQENLQSLKIVPLCSGVRQVSMSNNSGQIECLDEEGQVCIVKASD